MARDIEDMRLMIYTDSSAKVYMKRVSGTIEDIMNKHRHLAFVNYDEESMTDMDNWLENTDLFNVIFANPGMAMIIDVYRQDWDPRE